MKNIRIDKRHLAAALAVAIALAACNRSAPDSASGSSGDVPIADAESTDYTHLPGSEPPDGAGAEIDADTSDVFADAPATESEDADDPGRDAALRYMARAGGAEPEAADVPEEDVTRAAAEPRPDRALDVPPATRTAAAVARTAPAAPTAAPAVAEPPQETSAPRRPVAAAPAALPARNPDLARGLNQQGIALIGAGRPEQAIEVLERAVALQPRDAEMLGNLGYAYMLAGEHRRARANLLTALEFSPTRSATWLNLGQTYAELGQRDVALDAVLKGYRYSSRKPSVRSALQRAATGSRHSPAWRETAGLALARIGA